MDWCSFSFMAVCIKYSAQIAITQTEAVSTVTVLIYCDIKSLTLII